MANNNLDDINIDNLKSFNDILRLNTAGMTSYERGQQKLINEEKDQEKQLAKLIDSGEKFGKELVGIGQSLTTGSSSFGPLTKTITLLTSVASGMASKFGSVGKAVGEAIKLAGKVANTTIETFEKTYTGFEKLSQSGLVSSFDEIDNISSSTMITINDLSELLEGQGQTLAAWGGTAFTGVQEFKKLSGSLLTSRYDFQLLGITTKELAASQIKYMDYERKITGERQKFDAKHIEGFKKYLNNITDISIMTGERRDEVQKEIDLRLEEASYSIFVSKRTKEQNREDDKLLEITKFAFGPTTQKGIRDLMVGLKQGVIATSDEADVVRQHFGRLGVDILADLQKHLTDPLGQVSVVVDKMKRTNVKNLNILGNQAMMAGDTLDSKVAVELHKGAQFAKLNQKDIEVMIQNGKATPPTTTDEALARARIDMGDNNLTIQRLSMSIPLVTKSMRLISKAMNSLIKGVFNEVGKNVPELLIVMEDQDDVRDKITDSITDLANYNKRQLKAQERLNARKAAGKSGRLADEADNNEIKNVKALIKLENNNLAKLRQREQELAAKKEELEILKGYKSATERVNVSNTTANITGTGGGGSGGTGTGIAGTSGTGPTNVQSSVILNAIGSNEGAGSYDIAFGDQKDPKTGIIHNYINSTKVMTAAEWYASTHPGQQPKNLSDMTLNEVYRFQNYRDSKGNFAAVGKYQFLKGTLFGSPDRTTGKLTGGLLSQLGSISMDTKFDGNLQEKLAETLLERNTNALKSYGIPTTPGYIYMSWYIGAGGTKAIWDAVKSGRGNMSVADVYMAAGLGDPRPANPKLGKTRADEFERELGGQMAAAGAPKAKTGGIFDGPSTGYLIELHGRERMMIIPDNDGNSNMFYGKKPKQSEKLLAKLISMIDTNVDEMIDLMNEKISLQERMKSA